MKGELVVEHIPEILNMKCFSGWELSLGNFELKLNRVFYAIQLPDRIYIKPPQLIHFFYI